MHEERQTETKTLLSPEIIPLMYQKSSLGLLNFQWAALKSNSKKQQQLLVFLKLDGVMPECRDRGLYFAHLFNYFNFANYINLFCSVILE